MEYQEIWDKYKSYNMHVLEVPGEKIGKQEKYLK